MAVMEILATDVSIRLNVLIVVLLNFPAFWNILLHREVGSPRHFYDSSAASSRSSGVKGMTVFRLLDLEDDGIKIV